MNSEDFSRMILPVYDIEHGSDLRLRFMPTIDKYFKSFKDFEKKSDLEPQHINRVIRFIAYMYDRNSPMIHIHTDYNRRLQECAALAGFDFKKPDTKLLERIYRSSDQHMALMIFEYIRHQNNEEWAALCANTKIYYDNIHKMMAGHKVYKDAKQELDGQMVKGKMREINKEILADNRALYDQIFKENAVIKVARVKATTAESRTRSGGRQSV
jgi:hypothetical protein